VRPHGSGNDEGPPVGGPGLRLCRLGRGRAPGCGLDSSGITGDTVGGERRGPSPPTVVHWAGHPGPLRSTPGDLTFPTPPG